MVCHLNNEFVSTVFGAAFIVAADPLPLNPAARRLLRAPRFLKETIGLGYTSLFTSKIQNQPLAGALAGMTTECTTQAMRYHAQTAGAKPVSPEIAKGLGEHLYRPKLFHYDAIGRSTFRFGALFTISPLLEEEMKNRSISPAKAHITAGAIGGIGSGLLVEGSQLIGQVWRTNANHFSLLDPIKNNWQSIVLKMPKAAIFGMVAYGQIFQENC